MRIAPLGKITFQLRYRYDGGAKRLDLGTYPLLSLKDARAEGQRLKAQLEQGHDPKVIRLLEKQAILMADSIETLFRQWYDVGTTVEMLTGWVRGSHGISHRF